MRTLLLLLAATASALTLSGSAEPHPEPATQPGPSSRPGTYRVDPGHSGALFRIKHMNVAYYWGRFNHIEGTFQLSDEASECSVQITIDAASVDTNSEGRDKHVKGPDFFNVKEYPRITFTSKQVSIEGDAYTVVGDLTMTGATREVTIPMNRVGEAETPRGAKCGFEGEFTLDRKDFGMGALEGALGTEIRCILFIEAGRT
jgi:polyisoprenoid-binding protein YceI